MHQFRCRACFAGDAADYAAVKHNSAPLRPGLAHACDNGGCLGGNVALAELVGFLGMGA